jgi:hypothetical protein
MKMSIDLRSRTASIAADPVSPEVAPTMVACWPALEQRVVEHQAEKLQRDVLEGERRTMEKLEQMQAAVAQRLHGRHVWRVERGIGLGDQPRKVFSSNAVPTKGCMMRNATSP